MTDKYKTMTDEELLAEYASVTKTVSLQNVLQSAFKILNNSAYGALGNAGFIFFDPRIAIGVTTTGRYIIQHVSSHFESKINTLFKTEGKSRLIYNDTDSCRGDSLVYANEKQIPISELYDMFSNFTYEDEFNKNYVKPVSGVTTKSFNTTTKKIEDKHIKYVMKHRVKKEMFEITTESGASVIVTEDHSVIILRNGEYISVCPIDIDMENDIVINIDQNHNQRH